MLKPNAEKIAEAHAWVDAAYGQMQIAQTDFVARAAQLDLSKAIATSFLSRNPLVAEAPTGTGKTFAYLVGALAATQVDEFSINDPIVVSTATKALQQQLLGSDLPRMASAGLLSLANVSIAKGKSNYICLRSAEEALGVLKRSASDPELFLDEGLEQMESKELEPMVDAYVSGRWDGDFDGYEGTRPKSVRVIAVSSDTCNRKKCSHYKDCAFFKARANLATSKIVIANHDIILMDLWLSSSSDGIPTLPMSNYKIIFDEAHHLPEKAIKVGSFEAHLSTLMLALPKISGINKILKGSVELQKILATKDVKPEQFDRVKVSQPLRELVEACEEIEVDEENCVKRFPKGKLPGLLSDAVGRFVPVLTELATNLTRLANVLRETSFPPGSLSEKATELMRRALDIKGTAVSCSECFDSIASSSSNATWLFRKDDSMSINTSPLEGAEALQKLLWNNKRVISTALVSATLQDLGGFARFRKSAGLPASTEFMVLPFSFPYKESKLVVAGMANSPKPAERRMFLPELAVKLPAVVDPAEGTLILFPSWSMLREFAPKLKAKFGARKVRMQGEQNIKLLVKDHCADITAGEGAILMGVSTMSEGLDLPGRFCEHVIIIALPFAVPSSPVEQEIAELLGSKYFGERSLPDAMVRLVQMVGRLLRRESDRGRVTIFDRRLASTSYGRQMLQALPPFQKIIEPVAA